MSKKVDWSQFHQLVTNMLVWRGWRAVLGHRDVKVEAFKGKIRGNHAAFEYRAITVRKTIFLYSLSVTYDVSQSLSWAMCHSNYKPNILNGLCDFFFCLKNRGFFVVVVVFLLWFSVSMYLLWCLLFIHHYVIFLMVCRVSKHNKWEQTFTILQTEKHSCVVCHLF